MSKKHKADDLIENIMTVATIECSKCDQTKDAFLSDEYEAAEIFFKEGWRATDKNTYCPKCVKKYLKQ